MEFTKEICDTIFSITQKTRQLKMHLTDIECRALEGVIRSKVNYILKMIEDNLTYHEEKEYLSASDD